MFADVVFNKPIAPLTYSIPDGMSGVEPGVRVLVGLRDEKVKGIVYRLKDKTGLPRLKPIEEVLDREPVLNTDLIQTAEWISSYYLCSLGEALWTIIPKSVKRREKSVLMPVSDRPASEITLTEDQESVFTVLRESLKGEGGHYLLHGVTGSGKTEIYLRIIREVVEMGRGAILLVPEISLTPQTVRYFSSRVGDKLAVLHSRLTGAEKINEWHRILSGQKPIVIGARSAVFAPLRNIGIIIVDEEHETSYKSDETPRYSARSVAFYRARKHGSLLLLGSATPSVESYYRARMKSKLLLLPKRVMNQQLPGTRVTDLRKVRGACHISKTLQAAIEERLRREEQVILFLNRRGFAPYVYCENCGHVFRCKNCDITLTFHRKKKTMSCHYCGFFQPPPDVCPTCGDTGICFSGFGTEKIERILNGLFPGAVIVRMDTDTVRKRTAVDGILTAFSRKQIDILVGTQIVSKGLHFPDVTLVGVLNADISLNFPDFRAAERTFNLITQVSGRAGRSDKGGEVIIQTFNPSHYAIRTAKTQNYEEFYTREIKYRQTLLYPPFCRIVRLVFRGPNENRLIEEAERAVEFIKTNTDEFISILGPSFCPISRIKNNYRVHIIIKVEKTGPVKEVLRKLVVKRSDCYLEIDVDPVSML